VSYSGLLVVNVFVARLLSLLRRVARKGAADSLRELSPELVAELVQRVIFFKQALSTRPILELLQRSVLLWIRRLPGFE